MGVFVFSVFYLFILTEIDVVGNNREIFNEKFEILLFEIQTDPFRKITSWVSHCDKYFMPEVKTFG